MVNTPDSDPVIADNEAIYDEQIAPLMTQVLDICKAHGIPMVAAFEYAPEYLCTSYILPRGATSQLRQAASAVALKPSLMAFTITKAGPDGQVVS